MRNYLFLLLLIILASCVKEKDKPDIINHVLESKIEDNLYYSLSNTIASGQDDCIDIPNSKWTFNKSRYLNYSSIYGPIGCDLEIGTIVWSIIGDSLFIERKSQYMMSTIHCIILK